MNNEIKKDKKSKISTVKIIIGIITFIIIISVTIFAYFNIKEIKSYPTEEIEKSCNVETTTYKNRNVFTITPKDGAKNEKTVIYFHGGSYMAGVSQKQWELIEKLVIETGSTYIIPDYPLAPKYTCVNVYEMVEPLYKEIVSKTEKSNIIFIGDSAGGGLALGLLEKIDENIHPSKTVLISPWLDVTMKNEKMEEVQKNDENLNIYTLKLAGVAYAGAYNLDNYLVSPIYGDVSKLKNVTILTGTYDILNPDVYVLEEKIKKVGGNINVITYEKAQHNWIIDNNCDEELVKKGYQDLVSNIKN